MTIMMISNISGMIVVIISKFMIVRMMKMITAIIMIVIISRDLSSNSNNDNDNCPHLMTSMASILTNNLVY